jgi:DNA invertase Pin-like site-specific DNA recombinase
VSTDAQTTKNQRQELEAWVECAGHTVVRVFEDQGISGAKGRDKRPAFDALLKAAVRREIDMVAVWSSDRLARTIRNTGTGLYIHTQAVDTTTPAGRAMFGMLGVFAEFEREMIVARVKAGLERAWREGTVLGRPRVGGKVEDRARAELAKDTGILKTAKLIGLGSGTVQRIKREMATARAE